MERRVRIASYESLKQVPSDVLAIPAQRIELSKGYLIVRIPVRSILHMPSCPVC